MQADREFQQKQIWAAVEEEGRRLGKNLCVKLDLDLSAVMVLVAQLQLALRHPGNNGGAARGIARGLVDAAIHSVETAGYIELAKLMRLGDDPAYDTVFRLHEPVIVHRSGGPPASEENFCGRCGQRIVHRDGRWVTAGAGAFYCESDLPPAA